MKKKVRYWIIAMWIFLAVGIFIWVSYQATPNEIYTVTFKDADGTVLDTQQVAIYTAALAPEIAEKEGYFFVGWDKNFDYIVCDCTVTAQYVSAELPSIFVVGKTASPGEQVRIPMVILNNPGVAGAKFTIIFDPALSLVAAETGDAFAALDFTLPGKYMSPCSFNWDSEYGMVIADGYCLWLTFQVPADAVQGQTYAINCTYREGDVFNELLRDVTLQMINGIITVE